jgi:transposase
MFHLTDEQRRQLRAQLCSTDDVEVFRRTLALLEVHEGLSPEKISRTLGVSRSSVYNWLNAFERMPHPRAVTDHRGHGRSSLWTNALETLLREALQQSPHACGHQAAHWTVPLLQTHLHRQGGQRLSEPTIRRKLRRSGYAWQRAGYVQIGVFVPEKKILESAIGTSFSSPVIRQSVA